MPVERDEGASVRCSSFIASDTPRPKVETEAPGNTAYARGAGEPGSAVAANAMASSRDRSLGKPAGGPAKSVS